MTIWALSDLHLPFSNPSKNMSVFGPAWEQYAEKIEENWKDYIKSDDLILIPGDISWANTLEAAKTDLNWIHELPGTKLILRGNHDYWWASNAKLEKALPPSIHFIHNTAFNWNDISFGGSRLWDTEEYNFNSFIEFKENPRASKEAKIPSKEETQKIFEKELERLKLSLHCLNKNASTKIALTHYPPIGADLKPSLAGAILEEFKIDICVFGHLHSVKKDALSFGQSGGVKYLFTSSDYLEFKPLKVL